MNFSDLSWIASVVSLFVLVSLTGYNLHLRRTMKGLRSLLQVRQDEIEQALEKAKKVDSRSQSAYRSLYTAQAAERFAPYLPGFPLKAREVKNLGDPVDFVGFQNLGDELDTPITVVFIEVKTGSSTLGRDQERIRDAIEDGRVQWIEYRPRIPPLKEEI